MSLTVCRTNADRQDPNLDVTDVISQLRPSQYQCRRKKSAEGSRIISIDQFLIYRLDEEPLPGLYWSNRGELKFCVNWKQCGDNTWDMAVDGAIFNAYEWCKNGVSLRRHEIPFAKIRFRTAMTKCKHVRLVRDVKNSARSRKPSFKEYQFVGKIPVISMSQDNAPVNVAVVPPQSNHVPPCYNMPKLAALLTESTDVDDVAMECDDREGAERSLCDETTDSDNSLTSIADSESDPLMLFHREEAVQLGNIIQTFNDCEQNKSLEKLMDIYGLSPILDDERHMNDNDIDYLYDRSYDSCTISNEPYPQKISHRNDDPSLTGNLCTSHRNDDPSLTGNPGTSHRNDDFSLTGNPRINEILSSLLEDAPNSQNPTAISGMQDEHDEAYNYFGTIGAYSLIEALGIQRPATPTCDIESR